MTKSPSRTEVDRSDAPRRELLLVGLTLVVVAVLYRYAWIPGPWQEGLQFAEEVWRISVTGVGRWFSAWTIGDGQAFAVIAADPLGLDEGWELSQPAFRYWRAGFGWLSWAASLGQERWVPYGMAIAGVLALVATFLLAARLRPHLGRSAWLLVLNPAVFIAFAGDTSETLAVLALAYSLASGRWWASAALGVIRPSFLVALVGRWRSLTWGVFSAVTLGALWVVRFGLETGQYGSNFALPFAGYISEPSIQSLALAVFASLTVALGLRHRNWGWIASGLLVLCFSGFVVAEADNGWRAAGMLFVLWAFRPDYAGSVLGGRAPSGSMVSTMQTSEP